MSDQSQGLRQAAEKFLNQYRMVAFLLANTVLLFVCLNGAAAIFLRLLPEGPPSYIRTFGMEQILQVHPGWTEEDAYTFADDWTAGNKQVYEPFVRTRVPEYHGEFLNVSEFGFREVKDQGPWPPNDDAINVFVFGGSTTYGAGVSDGETIPSFLQEHLRAGTGNEGIYVYNFGRPSFISTQERILFELQVMDGHVPDVAVFIDGVNDFNEFDLSSDWNELLAESRRPPTVTGALRDLAAALPMGKLAAYVRRQVPDVDDTTPVDWSDYEDDELLSGVIAQLEGNRQMVEVVAAGYGVEPVFVLQPIPVYNYDFLTYDPFLNEWNVKKYGHMRTGYERLSELEETTGFEANVLWLGDIQRDRHENLYVDAVHYKASFANEIALYIYQHICQRDLLGQPCDLQAGGETP